MENTRSASKRSAGAVDPLAIATTGPFSPHAPGVQAPGACLPPLVRSAFPATHATASYAVAEVRLRAAVGEGTSHV